MTKKLRRRPAGSIIAGLIGLLCLAAVGLGGYATLIEPNRPQVEVVHVSLPGLPAALQGLRIVEISDLHITQPGRREGRAAALIDGLQPDLIVVAGDSIQHTVDLGQQEDWAAAAGAWLGSLNRPRLGIWMARGNSDISRYGDFNIAFAERMGQAGVRLLPNRAEALALGTDRLWLAGADFSDFRRDFVDDFRVVAQAGQAWIETGPSAGESTLHRWGDETLAWRDYEFSGRFMRTDAQGGIGVTFYSRFPDGLYRYYYFRNTKAAPTLHLALHGGKLAGERLDTGVEPAPGRWYRFRLRVQTGDAATQIRAKAWADDEAEPDWQAEYLDESSGRLAAGTVGLWGLDEGDKRFDDLRVSPSSGSPVPLLEEGFESAPAGQRPVGWLAWGVNAGNVRQALAGVPAGAPALLVAHSPDQALEALGTPAQLVLSGHTHGGQIRLPFVGAIYAGTALGRRYAAGLYRLDDLWLYVTRGIGTRTLPVRFLCPPEITLLILERGD